MYSRIPRGQHASIEGTAFAGNPVLSSTILASFHIAGRRALIPLLPRWAVLFRGVKTFGRVVWSCRNRCAAIGTEGVYPEVLTTPCGQSACGGDGDLKFFFPSWASAFVTVEENAGHWSHGVEFPDFYGEVIHKVLLTSHSNLDAFCWWVDMNHAPNPAAGHAPESRSPCRVEGSAALCEEDIRLLSQDDFRRFLRGLIESEIPVRISVGNDGLVQTVRITPNRLQEDDVSIYLGGEKAGLQLRKDRLAEVSLHRLCGFSTWILKAHESEGFVACAIAPTRSQDSQQ